MYASHSSGRIRGCSYSSCFSSHFCFLVIFVLLILVLSILFHFGEIIFFSTFLRNLLVIVSMYRCYLGYWRVMFFLFLIHTVCLPHLRDVRPDASSIVLLFSVPFVEVLLWYTLRMVLSILRGGQPRCLSLWWDFYNVVLVWVVFSFSGDF